MMLSRVSFPVCGRCQCSQSPLHDPNDRSRANDDVDGSRTFSHLAGTDPFQSLAPLEELLDMRSLSKLGEGSLGEVLLARDKEHRHQFAVKVVSLPRMFEVHGCDAHLRSEVKALCELNHPNLVRLVDVLMYRQRMPCVKREPPYVCLVTEYVQDSEPLSHSIRNCGPQPKLALHLAPQLAHVLAAMHLQGFAHLDVWSENVLVGKDGRAVLVDLGCAEHIKSPSTVAKHLNIPYMSPDSNGGAPQVADDCWALGLLLAEVTTGRFICERLGTSKVPMHTKPAELFEMKNEVANVGGPLLSTICTGLLCYQPKQRWTMADVITCVGGPPDLQGTLGSSVTSHGLLTPRRKAMRNRASSVAPTRAPSEASLQMSSFGNTHSRVVSNGSSLDAVSPCPSPVHRVGVDTARGFIATDLLSSTLNPRSGTASPTVIYNPASSGRFEALRTKSVAPVSPAARDTSRGMTSAPSTPVAASRGSFTAWPQSPQGLPSSGAVAQQFMIGQRVMYKARSNGIFYNGIVVGHLKAKNGLILSLDIGDMKQVEEEDLWRVKGSA